MYRNLILILVVSCLAGHSTAASSAEPLVRLELRTDPGFPITGHQQWMAFLQAFDFAGINFRAARAGDQPSITTRGTESARQYRVVGILTQDNLLLLPGLQVRRGQRKPLTDWLNRLRQQGSTALTAKRGAYGLTTEQLTTLHNALQPQVGFTTRGQPTGSVVQRLTRSLAIPLEIAPEARRALAGQDTVLDELKRLSRGTALAAALRPLNLALVPVSHPHGKAGIDIRADVPDQKRWPVGFRPHEKSPGEIAPAAFEFLDVEIHETPLNEALQAVEARLKIPILLDHRQMAKESLDPATSVSLPKTKTFYKKIIDRLLFQALLKSELRIDEANQPFLWCTPSR